MVTQQAQRGDLAEVTSFINNMASKKRNFSPLTELELSRVLSRDPHYGLKGLLVARSGGEIVGLTHAMRDGACGYIAYLLALDLEIATELSHSAESYLSVCSAIYVGSPETPLYHTVEGRFQPLWGSTELLEVDGSDPSLPHFLKQQGYKIDETHLSLTLDLLAYNSPVEVNTPVLQPELLRGDQCWYNAYSWYKRSSAEEFGQRNKALSVLLLRDREKVIGHIAWYPMRDQHSAALCDLEVATSYRGQGLGKYLLHAGLKQMTVEGFLRVELHTDPALSPVACALYRKLGFIEDATWYVFIKRTRSR